MRGLDKAREQRHSVVRAATMRGSGPRSNVCIRNISQHGMMITADVPPAHGSYVEIILGDRSIIARVAWTQDDRFGVHTREKLDVSLFGGSNNFAGTGRVNKPAQMARVSTMQLRAEWASRMLQQGVTAMFGVALVGAIGNLIFVHLHAISESIAVHLPH